MATHTETVVSPTTVADSSTVNTTIATVETPIPSTETVTPDSIIIPTGNFRSVTVYVQTADGDPLESARWIQSAGLFPTAARVRQTTDGRMAARMWLLDAAYSQMAVIAESGRQGVNYVWYEVAGDDGTTGIERTDQEATLQFREAPIDGPTGGLSIGGGS